MSYNSVKFDAFIIPLLIITIIFTALAYYGITNTRDYFYQSKIARSNQITNSYAYAFHKSADAETIIDNLITERLKIASDIIIRAKELNTDADLENLANLLQIDFIYHYNKEGEIINSSTVNHSENFTVKNNQSINFLKSNNKKKIGEFVKNKFNDDYYKYAYLKLADDSLIEIGIKTEKIHKFLVSFSPNNLLAEIKKIESIDKIYYLNASYQIIASTDTSILGNKIDNNEIINQLAQKNQYSRIIEIGQKRFYEVINPIKDFDHTFINENYQHQHQNSGYLALRYPLAENDALIKQITFYGVIFLVFLYLVFAYIFYLFYHKNKNLLQLVYYNQKTKLPNRKFFEEFLTDKLSDSSQEKNILMVDFNNFKTITLNFGYKYADDLVKKLTLELVKLNKEATVYHFSSKQFIFYIENYDFNEILHLSKKIKEFSKNVFEKCQVEEILQPQIAVVKIDKSEDNVEEVLKKANLTLEKAREKKVDFLFYDDYIAGEITRESILKRELRLAIDNENIDAIHLKYQPIFSLKKKKIIAFEALARMKSKFYGEVSPVEFINIAEKNQLIFPLTNLILKKAFYFSNLITKANSTEIRVSVNISGIDLMQDNFIEMINNNLVLTGASPQNIKLEITESVLLNNFNLLNNKLEKLRKNKIKIALDDFGTGYSSFYHLDELSLDLIKIDRYFLNKISKSQQDNMVIASIIEMIHRLGLEVVAEGVETKAQLDYLLSNNCDLIQGYYISRPVNKEEALALLKKDWSGLY
ncbi:GGDEF domain-containing phosphodiesterase [Halanaerobium salsuginis]|nr:GGDEF domain-containing phosphodiesterase [Halanaerobium salsuginis]